MDYFNFDEACSRWAFATTQNVLQLLILSTSLADNHSQICGSQAAAPSLSVTSAEEFPSTDTLSSMNQDVLEEGGLATPNQQKKSNMHTLEMLDTPVNNSSVGPDLPAAWDYSATSQHQDHLRALFHAVDTMIPATNALDSSTVVSQLSLAGPSTQSKKNRKVSRLLQSRLRFHPESVSCVGANDRMNVPSEIQIESPPRETSWIAHMPAYSHGFTNARLDLEPAFESSMRHWDPEIAAFSTGPLLIDPYGSYVDVDSFRSFVNSQTPSLSGPRELLGLPRSDMNIVAGLQDQRVCVFLLR